MPYRTHWHPRGILWEFYGDVTAAEIEEANDAFYQDERSDSAQFQVIDAREVTHVEWQERDIKTTAAFDVGADHSIKGVKVAFVATDPEVVDKLESYADLTRHFNSSWTVRGFESIDVAMAWVRS